MKSKKRRGRGKSKGSQFEREMAEKLSLWWTNKKRDDVFWRSSNSGGRATTRSKKRKRTSGHYGDIAAIDPIGGPLLDLMTIEIKRGYNDASIHDLLDRPYEERNTHFDNWIAQAREACENAGSFTWVLIHRRDRKDAMIWMDKSFYDLLIEYKARLTEVSNSCTLLLYIEGKRFEIYGCPLEDFLFLVGPARLTKLVEDV